MSSLFQFPRHNRLASLMHQAHHLVRWGIAILAITLATLSPSSAQETDMLLEDHPLAGSLYRVKTGALVDPDALKPDLQTATHVLIGEKHDNPVHHEKQAELVRRIGEAGRTGQITFEMIEQRYTDELRPRGEIDLTSLGKALEWEARGWPSWSQYAPIFEASLDADMRLKAGNPDRDDMMQVGRGSPVPDTAHDDLRWDRTYSEAQMDSLLDELVTAHCGMMGKDHLKPLATMQRYKDAFMARAMRQGHALSDVSVLIAGNGHVRRDRGVPMFLDDDDKVISIALIEVIRGQNDPQSYSAFNPELYDYVWFTPRVDEIDPCEKFREQLEKMKGKSS